MDATLIRKPNSNQRRERKKNHNVLHEVMRFD